MVMDVHGMMLSPSDAHGSVAKRRRFRHAVRCRPSCHEFVKAGRQEKGGLFHGKYGSWFVIPLIINIH